MKRYSALRCAGSHSLILCPSTLPKAGHALPSPSRPPSLPPYRLPSCSPFLYCLPPLCNSVPPSTNRSTIWSAARGSQQGRTHSRAAGGGHEMDDCVVPVNIMCSKTNAHPKGCPKSDRPKPIRAIAVVLTKAYASNAYRRSRSSTSANPLRLSTCGWDSLALRSWTRWNRSELGREGSAVRCG